MSAVSTFWLCSDQASTAECSEGRSHNEASCSATSLVRTSRRKASLSVAQRDDSRTRAMDRTMTLPLLGFDCQNKSRKYI